MDNGQNPFHNPRVKSRDESNESNYTVIRQYHATANII